ncbi:MAG TPA: TetR/AcrR family transcriptional regulator [Acidimicrobiales bacterium]|nr:TetR/AcrR family transcriptional regulator [Acidimicrobiales bacterium]
MPKVADPAIRTALIEHAARITAEEGREALTSRRLANAAGTSTMAVYTHFGSMVELRRELRREGFARLAAHLDAVEDTGDTVADLLALGRAYYRNAVANPNLYRAMFMDGPADEGDRDGIGLDTYDHLVRNIERCLEAGRFDRADPKHLANQFWATLHGLVALELSVLMTPDEVAACLVDTARSLLLAFGDSPAAAARSLTRAGAR